MKLSVNPTMNLSSINFKCKGGKGEAKVERLDFIPVINQQNKMFPCGFLNDVTAYVQFMIIDSLMQRMTCLSNVHSTRVMLANNGIH